MSIFEFAKNGFWSKQFFVTLIYMISRLFLAWTFKNFLAHTMQNKELLVYSEFTNFYFYVFYRDDDYYNPASMASIKAAEEEQMQDGETIEEFEDRVLNKRAGHLNHLLQAKLQDSMSLHFSELTQRNIRKQAAQKFYSILFLQKVTAVNIDQADAFGPIMITKGPNFDKCVL